MNQFPQGVNITFQNDLEKFLFPNVQIHPNKQTANNPLGTRQVLFHFFLYPVKSEVRILNTHSFCLSRHEVPVPVLESLKTFSNLGVFQISKCLQIYGHLYIRCLCLWLPGDRILCRRSLRRKEDSLRNGNAFCPSQKSEMSWWKTLCFSRAVP